MTSSDKPTTTTVDLVAPTLDRRYRITLQPPLGGQEPLAALFVLDANAYQPVMAQVAMLRSLGEETVPILTVGIGYPESDPETWLARRLLDLTPSVPARFRPGDSTNPADWGGLDRFLDFIDQQVQPLVREAFPAAARHRVLFGHSLGGLAVVRALLRRPASYEGWFAVSPSLWWEDRMALQDLAPWSAAAQQPARPPKVFLSVGGLEETPPKRLPKAPWAEGLTLEQEAAETARCRMIGNTLDLAEALRPTLERLGGEVMCRVLEGETHLSVVPSSLTAAFDLHFAPAE